MSSRVSRDDWEHGFRSRGGGTTIARGQVQHFTRPYFEYQLFEVLYPEHLPDLRGRKLVELGSAPGRHLIELRNRLGVEPYGVELTDSGVELNREVFSRHGVDPDQVLQADILAADFQRDNRESFDVVLSRGLLEHFDEPQAVIEAHVDLLRPGGTLIVIIPNVRGVYGTWLQRFHPDLYARHNLRLMELDLFRAAFENAATRDLHSGYLGLLDTYSFRVAPDRSRSAHRLAHLLHRLQRLLNPVLRIAAPRGDFASDRFGPFLIYIGRKTDSPADD